MEPINPVLETAKTNPTLTKPQRGKMLSKYFTVRHSVNPVCGHKLDLGRAPRHSNCKSCWFMLFSSVSEVTNRCKEIIETEGVLSLRQAMGDKFTKHYVNYSNEVV